MYASLTAITLFAAALCARADPSPSEPGPGAVYKEGGTCHIVWDANPNNAAAWKTMNIELMTGDNFNMIHLTTVGTVDGSKAGVFDFPCPGVDPNSAIYFYQFTSPTAADKFWTTRFTISGPNGETTPPANARQPGTNDPIPWGVGKLTDPSQATPPPGAASGSSAASGSASSLLPTSSALVSSASSVSSPVAPLPSSAPTPAALPTTSLPPVSAPRFTTSTSSTSSTPTSSPSGSAQAAQNAAVSRLALGLWTGATAVSVSVFGLVMLL